MKTCKNCGLEKEASTEFWHRSKRHKDGLAWWCKECAVTYSKNYRTLNAEKERKKVREWRSANPEKRRAQYWRGEDSRKRNDWAGTLLKNTRSSARGSDRVHAITKEDILRCFDRQNERCFYSGVKLDFNLVKHSPRYPSIDRIDSSKGYLPNNIVVASWWMNRAKFTYTAEDFISLVEEMRSVTAEDLASARRVGPFQEQRPVASLGEAVDRPDRLEEAS